MSVVGALCTGQVIILRLYYIFFFFVFRPERATTAGNDEESDNVTGIKLYRYIGAREEEKTAGSSYANDSEIANWRPTTTMTVSIRLKRTFPEIYTLTDIIVLQLTIIIITSVSATGKLPAVL